MTYKLVDDLLEIANSLAQLDGRRPKQASLRRAASTAYYALFHELAGMCADELVGWAKPFDVFTPIYRAIEHNQTKSVLAWATGNPSFGVAILRISAIFNVLQDARIEADYRPELFRLNRGQTLDLVDEAKAAVELVRKLSASERLKLSVALVTKSGKRK